MPYYLQGDFYPRYARGDPGFFSFLGNIGKSLLGSVPVIGPAIHALGKPASTAIVRAAPSFPGIGGAIGKAAQKVGGVVKKYPAISAAGGAAVAMAGGAAIAHHVMAGGGRKRRTMRVTNPKALRRSLRRVSGFARMARKVMHFTHPGHRGQLRFKFAKKRKRVC